MTASKRKANNEVYKEIKTILVSQPKPERSPYFELEEKYGLTIDWRQFIHVEPVSVKEFRKFKVYPEEYSAIIFTSKQSIDHFFRMMKELRKPISQNLRYFCLTKAIADYLQKFIVYRKRKVFVGTRKIQDLEVALNKFKDTEKFLLPCSNLGAQEVSNYLEKNEFDWKDALMYRTVSSDLSDLSDVTYDVLVFFSPLGIQSLFENFPDFRQNDTRMAIFGNTTSKAVEDNGLTIDIKAPAPNVPSMTKALENYLELSNKG